MLSDYNEHLQKEFESTADKNKIDQIIIETKEIGEMQSEDECDFGLFQCAYCPDGFNSIGELADTGFP